jgi:multisubunit Na+/H+ antiporter MnhC subunit
MIESNLVASLVGMLLSEETVTLTLLLVGQVSQGVYYEVPVQFKKTLNMQSVSWF